VIQETEQIPEVIVDGIGPVRRVREAMAPQVVENDPEAIGEGGSDPVPDAQVTAQGIGEDQGGPFPRAQGLVVQDDAVHALECHVPSIRKTPRASGAIKAVYSDYVKRVYGLRP
jgi:hypothetical protein